MSMRRSNEHGQALVELALVLFLFVCVLMGVVQWVMLGSAQLKLERTVRRAAWLGNVYNNAWINGTREEIRRLQPEARFPIKLSGSRETGMTYQASCTVPAIGMFRLFKPRGFVLKAQSRVIAYAPAPESTRSTHWSLSDAKKLYTEWVRALRP